MGLILAGFDFFKHLNPWHSLKSMTISTVIHPKGVLSWLGQPSSSTSNSLVYAFMDLALFTHQ